MPHNFSNCVGRLYRVDWILGEIVSFLIAAHWRQRMVCHIVIWCEGMYESVLTTGLFYGIKRTLDLIGYELYRLMEIRKTSIIHTFFL